MVVSKLFRIDAVITVTLIVRPIRRLHLEVVPSHMWTPIPMSSPFLERFLEVLFYQSAKHCDSAFISLVSNRRPFSFNFIFGNRKKYHGAKSGEYGGWGMIVILFFARNCWARTEVRRGDVIVKQPCLFSQFWATSSHVFTQSPQSIAVEPGIHSLAYWDKFFVYNPLDVKGSAHNRVLHFTSTCGRAHPPSCLDCWRVVMGTRKVAPCKRNQEHMVVIWCACTRGRGRYAQRATSLQRGNAVCSATVVPSNDF
jgi:hypothetical protein